MNGHYNKGDNADVPYKISNNERRKIKVNYRLYTTCKVGLI